MYLFDDAPYVDIVKAHLMNLRRLDEPVETGGISCLFTAFYSSC